MKEAIGGISLFQLVVLFLLLFTGVMCLTINHSKAFGVKDEIINILESDTFSSSSNNFTLSSDTVLNIVNYLNEMGYRTTGSCPSSDWIGYNRNGTKVSKNAAFCVRAVSVEDAYYKDIVSKCKSKKCNVTSDDFPSMAYYEIVLFYQLDVPVLKQVLNLKLYGATKVLFG